MNARIFLDTRAAKGEAPLKIAITHNKKTAYIPTGMKVLPTQWDKETRQVIKHKNSKELNVFLRSRLSFVERELMRLQNLDKTRGKSITEIKDMVMLELDPELKEKKASQDTFLARYRRFISLKEKKQTIDSHEWTIKKLSEFDRRLPSRRFEDITYDYLNDFYAHYSDLSINSRSILMRNIRAVFNDAIDAGVTQCYPFRRLSIKNEKTRKMSLTARQVGAIMYCKPRYVIYRDIFILMIYLRGINVVDLLSARRAQVVNGRLEYRRKKVGSLLSVKIEPEAWEIIKKYKGDEYLLNILEKNPNYRVFATNMNRGLKRLGRRFVEDRIVDGAFPTLSSNCARHTWATVGANLGISQDVISRGMGHSPGIRVTNTYIDFDMKLIDEANRKIIDSLKSFA